MNSIELRKLWDVFWHSKEHAMATPASLIVNNADDPTTLFNTAGMQPLVPYLMGKKHPSWAKKVYNIQWCIRTVDIDEVGDMHHLTFFEMMGNWSLGDYFKKEAIGWSWEFLTGSSWLWLDPAMFSVTVFEGDDDAPFDHEAKQLWLDIWMPEHRITALDKKENRRWPAGSTWPCGPDSEIFYRVGSWKPPTDSNPDNDEENRLEVRNNVFMWYYKDVAGLITEMENKNVDTGMWFERILMVKTWEKRKQQQEHAWNIYAIKDHMSVYGIDIFQTFFENLATYSTQPYTAENDTNTDLHKTVIASYRIVADHLRTSIFLVNEWLTPSNEGRGYVLRRIMRRGYYHLKKLCNEKFSLGDKEVLYRIVYDLCHTFVPFYAHLASWIEYNIKVIAEEMQQFELALQRWGKKLDDILQRHTWGIFSWKDAFLLYDTYGVPVELTQEIVAGAGLDVDMDAYHEALQDAKALSRSGAQQKFAKDINRADHIQWLPETIFVGYDTYESQKSTLLKDFTVQGKRYLVFDRTPLYAEWWGQTGDSGRVMLDDWEEIDIVDVQKYWGVYLHKVG